MVNGARSVFLRVLFQWVWRRQLLERSIPPSGDVMAGWSGVRPVMRPLKMSTTTWGSGTVRMPARVLGGPMPRRRTNS